jgi:hypothetical protein
LYFSSLPAPEKSGDGVRGGAAEIAYARALEMIRPAARVVIDAEHLEYAALHAIGDDDGGVRDDELAGSGHTARTAGLRIVGELNFERRDDNMSVRRSAASGLSRAT